MEFSNLETRSAAEKGAFLHLRHPVTGKLLYEGNSKDNSEKVAVGVYVRGSESREVQQQISEIERRKMKDRDAEKKGIAMVSTLIISFQAIEKDGVPLTTSKQDLEWFFSLSDSFVEQVMDFAKDRENFFQG